MVSAKGVVVQIRRAESADLEPLAQLWAQSFPGRRTVEDRVAQLEAGIPYGGLESSWILEDSGRLAGAFKAYYLTQYLGGVGVPMLGLAAVATAPTARRRGVGRAICRAALRIGRERGDLVSTLYPFRPSFYRALGWGAAGELYSFRFSPQSLPSYEEVSRVRAAVEEDTPDLAAVYARVAARSNGLIERAPGTWAYHLSKSSTYPFVYEANGIRGYILARFEAGDAPGAGILTVQELIAEDDDAYRGLLGWLSLQGDQFREVRYDARPDEYFEDHLTDPRPIGFRPARSLWYPTARVIRGPMLRVIDLPGLIGTLTDWGQRTESGFTIYLEIEDPELPHNTGPWTFALEGGRATLERGGDPRLVDAILRTDIATLSEILTGTLSPSAAFQLDKAEVEGSISALDRLFRPSKPFWLLDEF